MYPTEHPTAEMVLAYYRIQDDIARAEAYRAARQARTTRRGRGRGWATRPAGRPRVRLFGALRATSARS